MLVAQIRQLQNVAHHLRPLLAVDVVGGSEELQILLHDHVFVGAHEVGDVADARANFAVLVADHLAINARFAPGGLEQGRQHLDRGRLARAVGTDEAVAVAFFDGQIQVVERGQLTVLLGEVDGLDHGHVANPREPGAAESGNQRCSGGGAAGAGARCVRQGIDPTELHFAD